MHKFRLALFLCAGLLLTAGLPVSWTAHHKNTTFKSEHTTIRNKEITHLVFTEALNNGNFAPLKEFVAAEFVRHGNPEIEGPDELIGLINTYRNAFPDMIMIIDDVVAERDKIVTRWTASGTHTGELGGISPTGKRVTVSGISIERVQDAKIVEQWEHFDELGMMRQLGIIPR